MSSSPLGKPKEKVEMHYTLDHQKCACAWPALYGAPPEPAGFCTRLSLLLASAGQVTLFVNKMEMKAVAQFVKCDVIASGPSMSSTVKLRTFRRESKRSLVQFSMLTCYVCCLTTVLLQYSQSQSGVD